MCGIHGASNDEVDVRAFLEQHLGKRDAPSLLLRFRKSCMVLSEPSQALKLSSVFLSVSTHLPLFRSIPSISAVGGILGLK
jgi:hypothetical protein